MKKLLKLLTCLLVVLMLVSICACNSDTPEGNDPSGGRPSGNASKIPGLGEGTERPDFDKDFDYIPHYDWVASEPEPEYPEDEGPFTAYRMEAECADFTLASGEHFSDFNNYGFDLRYSGNLATRNLNKPGTIAKFCFTSDKSLSNVELRILVSGYPNRQLMLGEILTIRVNNRVVSTGDITVNYDECEELGHNSYMIFKLVNLPITILEGDNTIELVAVQAYGGNLDYIELNTSANISGFDNTNYFLQDEASEWEVIKAPTVAEAGTLRVTSQVPKSDNSGETETKTQNYTLPALSEDNGYDLEEKDGLYIYSFTLKNEKYEFTFNPNQTSLVTIDTNEDITFVGGEKTANVKVGQPLPQIVNNSGKQILGWYNREQPTSTWEDGDFVTPEEDITISPYFLPAGQTLDPGNNDHKNTKSVSRSEVAGVNGYIGRIYNFTLFDRLTEQGPGEHTNSGNDDVDYWYFRILTACGTSGSQLGIVGGRTYQFTYHFFNYGDDVIKFTPWQLQTGHDLSHADNASGAVKISGENGEITLQPGEGVDFVIEITLKNDNANIMTMIVLNEEIADGSLGVAISKVNVAADPTKTYTLNIASNVNATFKSNGQKTIQLGEFEALPEITNNTGRIIAGWYNVSNRSQQWASGAFMMPAEELTIAPYYQAVGTVLKPGRRSDANSSNGPCDNVNNVTLPSGYHTEPFIVGGEIGASFKFEDADKDSYFRILSAASITAKTFTYSVTFENLGSEDIAFHAIIVRGTTEMSPSQGAAISENFTLKPGDVASGSLTITYTGSNTNCLMFIYFDAPVTSGQLGVAISITETK